MRRVVGGFCGSCRSFWYPRQQSIQPKRKVLFVQATLPPILKLFAESAKGKSKNVDVNMEELVGNTDGFADSG
jgi:hypothetical protein